MGCGDTYGAGYIYHRLQSDDIEAAGRFAAAAATLKLEHEGPFMGDASEVGACLESLKTTWNGGACVRAKSPPVIAARKIREARLVHP